MYILLDLDGTLTNTASVNYKTRKDGLEETDVSVIPIMPDAISFIDKLKLMGHTPIIISDSHPKYVNPIAQRLFNLPALSLCDKPNIKKVNEYLIGLGYNTTKKEDFIVIGDTWLDIELARSLNFKSILTQFYTTFEVDERDGIGKAWHQLKSGPTYVVKKFNDILEILSNQENSLWAAEAVFFDISSTCAIRLHDSKMHDYRTLFRSLGRQEVGECDKYCIARYYTEFQREDRSQSTLNKLASSINNFIAHVVESAPQLKWDYITFVADKKTTNPPNKMKDFFEGINTGIEKINLFKWSDEVDGSIRNRPNYKERRAFIKDNLHVIPDSDLKAKSVIIIDDQFTSGGTAFEITDKLRAKGAKNILFITLFFMTSNVTSNKSCSKCGKPMQLKIKKSDGTKFFSCTPPQFRGDGCGYIENIVQ